jgi:hypothetical protein
MCLFSIQFLWLSQSGGHFSLWLALEIKIMASRFIQTADRDCSLQAAASSFLSLRTEREVSLRKKKDKKFPIASRPYKAKDQRLSPVRIKKTELTK